ncbi:hypothetical protein [Staphylococcus phage vB_StaM_PB50]|nr:hypothetical protein [Staphylococcus phage vB_StaM_PB50]
MNKFIKEVKELESKTGLTINVVEHEELKEMMVSNFNINRQRELKSLTIFTNENNDNQISKVVEAIEGYGKAVKGVKKEAEFLAYKEKDIKEFISSLEEKYNAEVINLNAKVSSTPVTVDVTINGSSITIDTILLNNYILEEALNVEELENKKKEVISLIDEDLQEA